ncbi:hypothetical protein C8T65DRAFT_735381 [Cerioporus squamosus]|nr:hypothetical protein C8T65DRAFT_735381 [Cerioporus squamosus]
MPPGCQKKAAIELDKHDFSDVALQLQAESAFSSPSSSALLSEHTPQNVTECSERAESAWRPPMKVSGTAPSESGLMVRREVVKAQLAQELASRQWTSSDLVSHSFGDLVPLQLAARILYLFLLHAVLAVATKESPNEDMPVEAWADICARAVFLTALQQGDVEDTAVDQLPTDGYVWRWHPCFYTSTEKHTVDFLNVVGVLAYVCAWSVDNTFDRHLPAVRFSTIPNPLLAFPLPHGKQDVRPDLVALPYTAFRKSQPSDTASNLMETTRILPFILADFPNVFSYARNPEVDVPKAPEDPIPPLQVMSHGSSTFISISTSTSDPFTELHEQLSLLSQPATHPIDLSSELQAMFDADKLDVSYACWPSILLSGENKQSDIRSGILQELVYMQQQRCTRPHLRSVLGLACTRDETVFLRADAIGTERCQIRNRSSTGVVELIQLVLGLTLANDERLGVHPAFVFQDVTRPFSSSKGAQAMPYRYRQAVYMDTGADSASGEATRFYLDHLVDNRGSLTGRHTVVWSAFREVDACDPSICEEHLGGGDRVFVGPYALKMYYADVETRAQKTDIEQYVRNHASQEGAKCVLLPDKTWRLEKVHRSVRGFAFENLIPETVRRKMTIRQEVVSVSPLKRTLAQYQSVAEVARAIADWLYTIGLLKRDISNGNILLALEEPSIFIKPLERTFLPSSGEPPTTIGLVRRKKHEPAGVIGLLHDLDRAGGVIPPIEDRSPAVMKFRTGTPPYMSIEVLLGSFRFHRVQNDMQSIFYVAYLFAFTYDAPATSTHPLENPSHGYCWPDAVNNWAFGPSLELLGLPKSGFFATRDKWLDLFERKTLKYWKEESLHKRALRELLVTLHDHCLWVGQDDADELFAEKQSSIVSRRRPSSRGTSVRLFQSLMHDVITANTL